jgi:hypothetical protein
MEKKYKQTDEHKKKIGEANKGEKNYQWKEENGSYNSIHKWVNKWKGKPNHCELCGTTEKRKYHWANIDHKYRRVLDDYISMCVPCHKKYDRKFKKL